MIRRLLNARRVRRAVRRDRCRITEEWCGIFIGRCYCTTHGYRWDPPVEKPCPGHAQPTDQLREGTWT